MGELLQLVTNYNYSETLFNSGSANLYSSQRLWNERHSRVFIEKEYLCLDEDTEKDAC